jgi:hypothetical protein
MQAVACWFKCVAQRLVTGGLVTLAVEALDGAIQPCCMDAIAHLACYTTDQSDNELELRVQLSVVWILCWHAVLVALMSTALDQLINRKQTFEGELERIEDRVSCILSVWLCLVCHCGLFVA